MAKPRLYALSTCVHCKNTKEFLDKNNIDYDCVHVDLLQGEEREHTIREIKKYNPDLSFPTLVGNDDKVVVGYKENEILEACGT
ncbi:MAG: glutaredoxin family protein [Thermodesulfobacteriota bacterium]